MTIFSLLEGRFAAGLLLALAFLRAWHAKLGARTYSRMEMYPDLNWAAAHGFETLYPYDA